MNSTWKRTISVGLIVLNVALLAVLVHLNMAPAQAQVFRKTNYVMAVGSIGEDYEAIHITDLASKRMITLKWNKSTRRMEAFGPKDLTQDFQR